MSSRVARRMGTSRFRCTVLSSFLVDEGVGHFHVVERAEVAEGRMDVAQAAVSASWFFLDRGQKPPVANFAQVNRFDGFIIAARQPDPNFTWSKLKGGRFLHVHGGQPEAMLRYGLHRQGIDLSELDDIDSPGGDEMMRQWRDGQGDFFHEQGCRLSDHGDRRVRCRRG